MTPAEVAAQHARPHVVYTMRDVEGAVIYVGISLNLPGRLHDHAADKPWYSEVSRVDCEHVADRESALAREAELIRDLHPKYNRTNPAGPRAAKPASPGQLLVTIPTAAEMLSVGRDEVYRLLGTGDLRRVTIGKRGARIVVESITAYVERLQAAPAPAPELRRRDLRVAS